MERQPVLGDISLLEAVGKAVRLHRTSLRIPQASTDQAGKGDSELVGVELRIAANQRGSFLWTYD